MFLPPQKTNVPTDVRLLDASSIRVYLCNMGERIWP